jgi:hypothetical protein
MSMAVYNLYDFPMFSKVKEDDIVAEARNIFDTYADDVQVEPFTGEVSIRNAVRLSEDSPYKDAMLSEDDFVELERRLGLFSHLRNDDSGTGKSNIDYICEYKVKDDSPYFDMNKSLREQLMEEKLREEKEFYESIKEENSNVKNNRFLNEVNELK